MEDTASVLYKIRIDNLRLKFLYFAVGDCINLKWLEDMKLTVPEALVSLGPAYLTAFFKTNICDMNISN